MGWARATRANSLWLPPTLLIGGGLVAAAVLISGHPFQAVVLLGLEFIAASIALIVRGHTGTQVPTPAEDALRDIKATAIAGMAMGTVALGGSLIELANQRPGPFMIVSAAGALSYVVALVLLRHSRPSP